jgi:integrase
MQRFQLGIYWLERRKGTANWQRTWRDSRGVKQRASLGTADFEQAKVALAEWYVANATIRDQAPEDVPIGTLLTRYLARHGDHIPSKDTAKRAADLWREYWGDRTVADLTVDAQEDFVKWLRSRTYRGKPYSEGYVRRVLGVGQSALNRAWKRQEIVQVPWVELPPIGEPYPHTATIDQLAAFLNAIPKDSHLWTYCMIRLGTGCRGDAALGLQPFQVDWQAGLIRLNPAGRQQTKKYRPVVPLTEMLRRELAGCDAAYYVHWHGKRIGSIKKAWAKVRVAAKLPAWFIPKVLRHTVATELRRRGVPGWEVSGQIGHKAAGTSEIYAKFDPGYLGQARVALDALVDELAAKVPRLGVSPGSVTIESRNGAKPESRAVAGLLLVGGTRIELVTPTMSRSGKISKNKD